MEDMTTRSCDDKHRRRKLRRLASEGNTIGLVAANGNKQRPKRTLIQKLSLCFYIGIFVVMTGAVLFGHYLRQNHTPAEQGGFLDDFLNTYRQQYYNILHGKLFYCDPNLDTQTLFNNIRSHEILHQEVALKQLEMLLSNNSQNIAVALVGPSGVGKSLFAQALQKNFAWRENVHYYAWNTHVKSESKKFQMLRLFVSFFSDCGRNLLIVDNLSPCDREVVPLLQNLVETQPYASRKHVILVHIFNLNRLSDANLYEHQLNALQSLPGAVTVNFQPMSEEALHDCVLREANITKLQISDSAMTEIVDTVDWYSSGCKNVHAKVLVYGQSKN